MSSVPKITIEELNSSSEDFYVVDVRSPKEFNEDHILNSINMPILNDEQRHIVGYTYKQIDPDKALELGYEILNKKVDDYVSRLKKIDKKIVIMCFRGGMRSKSVTEFLVKKGINASQLEDGYKAYRKNVKEFLENFDYSKKKIYVIYGLTGTNKTKIIQGIESSIDLEGLANHRGSLFGGVGLKPSTQKRFDSIFLDELSKSKKNIIVEGESNKIGDIFIPKNFFKEMQKAELILIKMSIDQRIKNILEDYFDSKEKIKEVKEIVPKLKSRLGKKKINELLDLIDSKKYYGFVKILLEEYYDLLYKNTVDNKEYSLIIETDDSNEAIETIKKYLKSE